MVVTQLPKEGGPFFAASSAQVTPRLSLACECCMGARSRDQGKIPNRRRHVRVEAAAGAPIRIDLNGPGFMEVLNARDISISGVGIEVAHGFENCRVQQTVKLLVRLPAPVNANIGCSGQIRHISDVHFGILFTNLKPDHARLLRRYVASRLGDQPWWTRLRFALHLI